MGTSTPAKILIVEDTPAIAKVFELKLKKAGFTPEIAASGEAAVDKLKKEQFDLVLLDLILPKMNGFEVLEEIEKLPVKPPVIVTSNLGQTEDIERAKRLGARDYFVKSDVSLSDMIERASKFLRPVASAA